jgi:putative membrane protein
MTIIQDTREQARRGSALMATTQFCIAMALVAALGGPTAAAQTAIPPTTADFVVGATQSNVYEILAGRDAIAQSQNPRIRTFAQQMIDDHTRTSESVRRAATASGLPSPPPAMGADQAVMLASLQSLRGAEFDQTYARQQVLAHRQALAVAESYAKSGADANMRKVAQSAVPLIQHHLEMAEQIRSALGAS